MNKNTSVYTCTCKWGEGGGGRDGGGYGIRKPITHQPQHFHRLAFPLAEDLGLGHQHLLFSHTLLRWQPVPRLQVVAQILLHLASLSAQQQPILPIQ